MGKIELDAGGVNDLVIGTFAEFRLIALRLRVTAPAVGGMPGDPKRSVFYCIFGIVLRGYFKI